MDGTLLNTIDDIADAMNRTLVAYNFPIHQTEAYKQMVGKGITELVRQALPERQFTDEEFGQIFQQFADDYLSNWDVKTKLYQGIEPLLTELKRRKIKLAILSNKPQNGTEKCESRFFPDRPFEIVFGKRDGIPAKPDPVLAIEIADKFNIDVKNILFIGDSSIDMQTGKQAGMICVGVTWGFRSREELESSGADYIIDEPMQLIKVIEGEV